MVHEALCSQLVDMLPEPVHERVAALPKEVVVIDGPAAVLRARVRREAASDGRLAVGGGVLRLCGLMARRAR